MPPRRGQGHGAASRTPLPARRRRELRLRAQERVRAPRRPAVGRAEHRPPLPGARAAQARRAGGGRARRAAAAPARPADLRDHGGGPRRAASAGSTRRRRRRPATATTSTSSSSPAPRPAEAELLAVVRGASARRCWASCTRCARSPPAPTRSPALLTEGAALQVEARLRLLDRAEHDAPALAAAVRADRPPARRSRTCGRAGPLQGRDRRSNCGIEGEGPGVAPGRGRRVNAGSHDVRRPLSALTADIAAPSTQVARGRGGTARRSRA